MGIKTWTAAGVAALALAGCGGADHATETVTHTVTATETATVTQQAEAESATTEPPGEVQVLAVQAVWDAQTEESREIVCDTWASDPDTVLQVFRDAGLDVSDEAIEVVMVRDCG